MTAISKQNLDLEIFLQTLAHPKEYYIDWLENKIIDFQDSFTESYNNGLYLMLDLAKDYKNDFLVYYNCYSLNKNKQTIFTLAIRDIINLYNSDGNQIDIGNQTYIQLVAS